MMTLSPRVFLFSVLALAASVVNPPPALAQNARLAGFVLDPQRRAVADATVSLTNEATGVLRSTNSDAGGAYSLAGLPPSTYRVDVAGAGFAPWSRSGVVLEVQQEARLDIALDVAGIAETTVVEGAVSPLGTHDGSLGLVVDRRFVKNTPLAGRTFQAVIELAPGVVYAPSTAGTFSINGQRRDSNYLMIDGVSANFNIGGIATQASVGTGESPAVGATGGYNGLVSVDAIQEVRVQTSSFAPEYGRTPGGQIAVVTRSGSNALHGSVSGTFRPDALQANDWYANYLGLSTAEFGQRIYAGVLGGAVVKNRLFYFGSYERIRLRNPIARTMEVPSLALRSSVPEAVRVLLAGWPVPTGPDLDAVRAVYAVSDARPTQDDAPAIRLDTQLLPRLTIFGRYAHSQSTVSSRTASQTDVARETNTLTLGSTWLPADALAAEIRFNYSSASSATAVLPLTADGALPPPDSAWPSFVDRSRGYVQYGLPWGAVIDSGFFGDTRQRQINVVGTLSYSRGNHHAKVGADIRTLAPVVEPPNVTVGVLFGSVSGLSAGVPSTLVYGTYHSGRATFDNWSLFAQDTWRYGRRLATTFGLRWDVNPAPQFEGGRPFHAVNASDVARLDVVESDAPLWPTRYSSIAPRMGMSYALTDDGRATVSGGGGVFYDLGTQSSGSLLSGNLFPFFNSYITSATSASVPPPPPGVLDPVRLGNTPYTGTIYLVDPSMQTPRSVQWNVKVEHETGAGQLVSVAYSGNRGARLLATQQYRAPNARFSDNVNILRSDARSTYHALLVQYRRRTLGRVQMTASYTLSSARDNVSTSASSAADRQPSEEWGPSEFDVRHNVVAAVTVEAPRMSRKWLKVANGWGVDMFLRARSAFPLSISTGRDGLNTGLGTAERPNVVADQPVWIDDASVPAGQRLNRNAFSLPPSGTQGNLMRNSVRGLPAKQVDLSLRRSFALAKMEVQVRLDAYNAFNWPQHGQFVTSLSSARFGLSQSSLNARSSNVQSASAQYSPGGSRTCDLQLRVSF